MRNNTIELKQFPQKRVIITGAGSGLGRALALDFSRINFRVAVADISKERIQETAALINSQGGQSLEMFCDVTKPEDLENAATILKKEWGGVDILINNAGVSAAGYFDKIPLDKWDWIIKINLSGPIHGCKAFIPLLKAQGYGHIVNVASCAGIASLPEMSSYNATKAAVISISETLRIELSPHNIGVSVVCPTFFKTNLLDQFESTDERQRIAAETMFQMSLMTSEEISHHILNAIRKNRFYVVSQKDGKLIWMMKRFFPELYFTILPFLYKKGFFDWLAGIDGKH